MPNFQATDATGAQYTLAGGFDGAGQIFTPLHGLAAGTSVLTAPAPGTPVDRTVTTPNGGTATTFCAANPSRKNITFQVPTGAVTVWLNWTGTAAANGSGSFAFLPGTQLVTLGVDVVGTGAISICSTPSSVQVPATES